MNEAHLPVKLNFKRISYEDLSGKLYWTIMTSWLLIMTVFEYYTILDGIIPNFKSHKPIMAMLLILNQIFVAIFFYYGLSNLFLPLFYMRVKRFAVDREKYIQSKPFPSGFNPRVQLLYTTYNDFIPYALNQCLQQTYENVQAVILDNSTEQKYIDEIAQFVKVHPYVKWVRDVPNYHAKAGNLDNYLCNEGKGTYDYFVILDSDELLEPTFVEKALKYFLYNPNLGVLQANHISGRNENSFMRMFSNSGNTFWPVQNTVRSLYSGVRTTNIQSKKRQPKIVKNGDTVCIELGHGVMFSRECFDDIGKMPFMVAEDLCTSFEVLLKGWDIEFAIALYGNEEFPVNSAALMVRSSKFCSANFQFMRVYGMRLWKTKLFTRRQKLDLLTFTLSTPIFAFEYISLILCSIILPLGHAQMGYQSFMVVPTLVCYFSQMLPDAIFELQMGMKLSKVVNYEFQTALLYGSMYYLTVRCTYLALIGKPAKFNVTPKENERFTLWDALKLNGSGMIFSIITILASILCSSSSWVLLSFLPGCLGFIMTMKSNYQNNDDKKKMALLTRANHDALTDGSKKAVPWTT